MTPEVPRFESSRKNQASPAEGQLAFHAASCANLDRGPIRARDLPILDHESALRAGVNFAHNWKIGKIF